MLTAGNHDVCFDAPFYEREWATLGAAGTTPFRQDDAAVRALVLEADVQGAADAAARAEGARAVSDKGAVGGGAASPLSVGGEEPAAEGRSGQRGGGGESGSSAEYGAGPAASAGGGDDGGPNRQSLRYLINASCVVRGGLRVWGSPHTPVNTLFGAYQVLREEMAAVWAAIPDDVDVLLTHGPPAGLCDYTKRATPDGCAHLREAVLGRPPERRPVLHVFGHIHEGYGVAEEGGVVFANAATCTSRQVPTDPRLLGSNAPLVFDVAWPGK